MLNLCFKKWLDFRLDFRLRTPPYMNYAALQSADKIKGDKALGVVEVITLSADD